MTWANQRSKNAGVTAVEVALAIVVAAIIIGVGVYIVHQRTVKAPASSNTAASAPAGTTTSINQLTTGDAQAEQRADTSADTQTERDALSANSTASNVGGAYDESTL